MAEYLDRSGLEYLIESMQNKVKQEIENMNIKDNYIQTSSNLCPYRKNYYAKNAGNNWTSLQNATYIEEQFQYCLGEKCMKYDIENDKCGRD